MEIFFCFFSRVSFLNLILNNNTYNIDNNQNFNKKKKNENAFVSNRKFIRI